MPPWVAPPARRSSSRTAVVQARRQAAALCCRVQVRRTHACEAVHQVRRGNQQPARGPTVRRPARSVRELVDGRRKKNAAHTRTLANNSIGSGALKQLGSRLPSSFLFVGRVLPSPSSTASTLVLARQITSLSPSVLGLLF